MKQEKLHLKLCLAVQIIFCFFRHWDSNSKSCGCHLLKEIACNNWANPWVHNAKKHIYWQAWETRFGNLFLCNSSATPLPVGGWGFYRPHKLLPSSPQRCRLLPPSVPSSYWSHLVDCHFIPFRSGIGSLLISSKVWANECWGYLDFDNGRLNNMILHGISWPFFFFLNYIERSKS